MKKTSILLIKALIALIILLAVLYMVITSDMFVRKVIIPIAASKTDSKISVVSVDISPLRSRFGFSGLNFQNKECNAKIEKFECYFDIFSLLSGKVRMKNTFLENSFIEITSPAPTETSSSQKKPAKKKDSTPSESKHYVFNIRNFNIINFNLKYAVQRENPQDNTTTQIKNFNMSVPSFKTSGDMNVRLNSDIFFASAGRELSGTVSGNLTGKLNDKTIPTEMAMKSQLKLDNQVSEIEAGIKSEDKAGKTPFSLYAAIENLPLQPFFQTFLKDSYQNTSGYINSFSINASGADLNSAKSLKGVNGTMKAALSNIYIPMEMADNPIVRLILLPVNILSGVDPNAPQVSMTKLTSSLMNTSKEVLDGKTIIEFSKGNIEATMDDGNTEIITFAFQGSSRSAIRSVEMAGIINQNQSINLKTKTNISGLDVPLHITGTLKNPAPDSVDMFKAILKNSAGAIDSILGASSSNPDVQNVSKSINNVVDSLSGGSSSGSSQSSESIGGLIQSIKSFGK